MHKPPTTSRRSRRRLPIVLALVLSGVCAHTGWAQQEARPTAKPAGAEKAPKAKPAAATSTQQSSARWWDIPLSDRLNRRLDALGNQVREGTQEPLANQLNRGVDSIFNGVSLLFRAPKGENLAWWEKPLADRLNARIDRVQATIAGLEARDFAQAARQLGLDGPVLRPSPVLPPPSAKLDPEATLTLMDVWRAAMVNDRTLRAARAGAQAAMERAPQARAQALPQVQFSASQFANNVARDGTNTLNQPLQIFDRYESSNQTLSVRQPLIRAALPHQLAQARWVGEEAQAVLRRETQNLAAKVAGTYLEALLAQDQLTLVQAQQRFLRTVVAAETRALAAGSGTRTAVDEATARLDLNRAQELEARQAVDLTRRQLEVLVNQPVGRLARLDPQDRSLEGLVQGGLDDWVALALRSSPEVQALQAQLGQLREEVGKARAGHFPTVDLVAQAQRSRSENVINPQARLTNQLVGVQVNVPLYNAGFVNSQTRQASAEAERTREQLEALRLDLGVRIHREYRGVTEGALRVRSLEVAARSADVALDSATKSMAAGVRSLVDVLNAEQQRAQVLRDLAQARYLSVASAVRLQALAGVVDEEIMMRIGAIFKP
jgi:protease secretion system outer membrane protein